MLIGPVDEIWQHRKKIRARCGQHEWNKMEHQIVEEGHGTCQGVSSERPSLFERHGLVFFNQGQWQTQGEHG